MTLRPSLTDAVYRYRGGYTKTQRRDLEQRLFSGALLGIITTNALELGINVGSLDATIHLGVPSSQSSLVRLYFLAFFVD
jgi:DEAD/DEAH box helicase domain-containing protein